MEDGEKSGGGDQKVPTGELFSGRQKAKGGVAAAKSVLWEQALASRTAQQVSRAPRLGD